MLIEGVEVFPGGKKILVNGLPVEMMEFANTTGCARDFYQRDAADKGVGQLQEFSRLEYGQLPISLFNQSGFTEWVEIIEPDQSNRAHKSVFVQSAINGIPVRIRLEFLDESRQNNSTAEDGLMCWGTAMFKPQDGKTIKLSYGIDQLQHPTFKLSYFYPDSELKRRFDYIAWTKSVALLGLGRHFDQVRGDGGIVSIKDYDLLLKIVDGQITIHDRIGQTTLDASNHLLWQGPVMAINSPFYGLASVRGDGDSIQIAGATSSTEIGLKGWEKVFESCTDFNYESALLGLVRLQRRLSLKDELTSLTAEV